MSPTFYGPHGMAKETLASGGVIPDGGYFEMSEEDAQDPHNVRLIEEGKILPVTDKELKSVEKTAAMNQEVATAVEEASGGDGQEGGD